MVVPTSVAVKTLFSSLVTPRAMTDGEVIVMDAFLRPRFFLDASQLLAPSNKIKQ
jgi:hypothetical protein